MGTSRIAVGRLAGAARAVTRPVRGRVEEALRAAGPVRGPAVAVRDAAVAVGVAGVLLLAGLAEGEGGAWPGYGLLVAGGLVLVVRRRAPVVALAGAGACAVGYQAAGFD